MNDFTEADRDRALMEAHCIEKEDEYFAARPQIDCSDRRKVFQSAFERAWKAARAPLLEQIENLKGECTAADKLINGQMDELAAAKAINKQYAKSLKNQSQLIHVMHDKIAELEKDPSANCPRCGMANRIAGMRAK